MVKLGYKERCKNNKNHKAHFLIHTYCNSEYVLVFCIFSNVFKKDTCETK